MAFNVIQGKSYSVDNGLSDQVLPWFVVGRISVPIKVDKTLGWRDTNLDKPNFVSCAAFMCIPCDSIGNILSDECFIVPFFAVTEVLVSGDERYPTAIKAPAFIDEYQLSNTYADYIVQYTSPQPIRIDDNLTWRYPLNNEEPVFVSADVSVVLPATGPPYTAIGSSTSRVPMFMVSNVYSWITVIGSSGSGGGMGPIGPRGFQGETGPQGDIGNEGLQGPQGNQGFRGLQGFQGNQGFRGPTGSNGIGIQGPQGFQGPQGNQGPTGNDGIGNQGPQGFQGVTGPVSLMTAIEVNSGAFFGTFDNYYGIVYTSGDVIFTLPVGSSPVDDGRMLTVTDETGSVSGVSIGVYLSSNIGQLINGETQLIMKMDYMSITLMFRNNSWHIYSTYMPTVWSTFSDLK